MKTEMETPRSASHSPSHAAHPAPRSAARSSVNWNVLGAIFKRNFISYFSNPTGYVFICVFVMLSSLAAFWPVEFFASNLANLDQLNRYLPYIMLVFIPAITMSMWAEERRQGTDELLLTIPATDLDVVLGKFFAALAIFSVALCFSMISNYVVLFTLGQPDAGLFISTYIGYWMVGMAMLSVGMAASFLTSNLTVGFILGVLFNSPLALSGLFESRLVRQWSVASQVMDFQRGVISISSISYFVMLTVVMLYLSIVLIGRRHWMGGRDGRSMLGHYFSRTCSLLIIAAAANYFFFHHDFFRLDITRERLTSLSPQTKDLIRKMEPKHPIEIEAFLSPEVPREYVQAKLDLTSTLAELESLGGGKIRVTKHEIENFSDDAVRAEKAYGIKPQTVFTKSRGTRSQEEVFMGLVFKCGLEKVVVPFLDKGIPVEYELVRSIATVAQENRKKVGILKTDVQLMGGFDFQTMSTSNDQMLIQELRKQYEVVEVDASKPIEEKYDVLLAVQPSTLSPEQMDNFIDYVKKGNPTAIFEDPAPQFFPGIAGTGQPRRPRQSQMMMMPPQQQGKGDINQLWDLLGVRFTDDTMVWQNYNPLKKGESFITRDWVFIDDDSPANASFSQKDPITSRMHRVLFLFPGSISRMNRSKLGFERLATTGEKTGTLDYQDLQAARRLTDLDFHRQDTKEKYVVAARITGKPPRDEFAPLGGDLFPAKKSDDHDHDEHEHDEHDHDGHDDDAASAASADPGACLVDDEKSDDASDKTNVADKKEVDKKETAKKKLEAKPEGGKSKDSGEPELDVVLVADIDCLVSDFFFIRSRGKEEMEDMPDFDFDNVTFVLNVLDVLADDDRFVEIRKRRRVHRPLEKIEERTDEAQKKAMEERSKFSADFQRAKDAAQRDFDQQIDAIKKSDLNENQKMVQILMLQRDGQQRLETRVAQLEQDRDRKMKQIERELQAEVSHVQDYYKRCALIIPAIPPLLVAFFVFFHRRSREQEGVSRSRLR